MELKKDEVLFINLIFRVVAIIIFVSDYESPVLKVRNAVFNWNRPVTNRVVLILANGLRDDFLDEGKTPFLRNIANENGTFARVVVEGVVTVDGSLRNLLSGLPWHGSLFPWNRPAKYKTILDYTPCKCVVGRLPASSRCHHPARNQSEVFERFSRMTPTDCLYVLSFDFGGATARDYLRMLLQLDEDVRKASETWGETTWLLTSSRGWSVWNRTDGRVDIPLLTWGKGILPTRGTRTIQLMDVPALVSTLLGQSFPPGCLAVVPIYLISASPNAKFRMSLYNYEHLEKSLGGAEELEFRNPNGIDEENIFSLKLFMNSFMEMVRGLRMTRMRIFAIFAVVYFGFWSVGFLVVASRGSLTVDVTSSVVVINMIGVVGLITYINPDIFHVALMVLLTPISILSVSDVVKTFHTEGCRMFLLSLILLVVCTLFISIGNHAAIILLMIPVGLWPFAVRVARRMNRKVLMSWYVSAVVLCVLPFFDIIGRDPTPGVTILSSVFHVGLFHFAYHSFKRRVDRQSWVITAVVLSSTYHIYFWHSWGFTSITCLLSWCYLLYSVAAVFILRGTLLERLLKFHLILLIPMQILSNRHESLFHVSLALHMFSWVFTEYVSVEKTVLYNPSIFTLERLSDFPSDNLQPKYYRQVFFFMTYAYLSYFAVGNLPTVYTYDYVILKPFCDLFPFVLIPLKLILPFVSLTYAFLTLHFTQRTDPATSIILCVHYSDVISSCFLLYAYILTDVFTVNASHYIILQTATATITALYLLQRYGCFHRKT